MCRLWITETQISYNHSHLSSCVSPVCLFGNLFVAYECIMVMMFDLRCGFDSTILFQLTTLGKLYIHKRLCHQALTLTMCTGQRPVMLCVWEDDCMSGITLATCYRFQWSNLSTGSWPVKGRYEHPAYAPQGVWHPSPFKTRNFIYLFIFIYRLDASPVRDVVFSYHWLLLKDVNNCVIKFVNVVES